MNASIIGQERVVERLIIALLSNGNVLPEGLPGLAKTRAIKSLSQALESEFSRVQFTPDLLPSDVTGGEIHGTDGSGNAGASRPDSDLAHRSFPGGTFCTPIKGPVPMPFDIDGYASRNASA